MVEKLSWPWGQAHSHETFPCDACLPDRVRSVRAFYSFLLVISTKDDPSSIAEDET